MPVPVLRLAGYVGVPPVLGTETTPLLKPSPVSLVSMKKTLSLVSSIARV